jgi:beta-glucosidase
MLNNTTSNVDTLLAQMTLDEKIAQLGSYWFYELQTDGELDAHKVTAKLRHGIGQITRLAGASRLDPVSAARTANTIQKILIENTRLRIPAIIHEECCSGAMILGGSAFPQMIGLASTFQPELAEAMTSAIRKRLRAIGANQGLAPMLDIGRDPHWGRIEETFGEDPTLVSHFGAAYVRGLQGESLAEGVLATGKYFIGHSLSQGGLNCGPVQPGMRELYEVYLAPFQAAIRDAGLGSIMNAYPELDGEVVAASKRILTGLLRDELGFDGLVVSDYNAVSMLHNYHYIAADLAAEARLGLEAGVDVELPTIACYGDALKAALEAADLSLETVETAVRRHIQKKSELGLFDNPYVDVARAIELFGTTENRALARHIAAQSIVLLKNDGILPLKKTLNSLAVIGPNADAGRNQLGDYSYPVNCELLAYQAPLNSSFMIGNFSAPSDHQIHLVSVLEGIKEKISTDTQIFYAKGRDNLAAEKGGFDQAVQAARQAEAIVLVLGDRSGLVPDCTTGETRDSMGLQLPGVQAELAEAILATGKPVVIVLTNGRPFAIPKLAKHANAILEAWLPREEGGRMEKLRRSMHSAMD